MTLIQAIAHSNKHKTKIFAENVENRFIINTDPREDIDWEVYVRNTHQDINRPQY